MSSHQAHGSGSATTSATVLDRLSPSGRLLGLDVARGVALFAMMITHIFALSDEASLPTGAAIFAGRASALFAVLAGCSLVLSTRTRLQTSGRLRDAAPGVLIRAAAIVLIGLCLGSISGLLAVILVNYGVMFALALFFLRLRARALFVLAGAWMVLSPVVSMIVRAEFGLEPGYLPMSWFDLATPVSMLTDLFLTGYYPILQWLSYILLGIAVAKIDISRHLMALLVSGLGLFVLGRGASWLLLNVAGGYGALVENSQRLGIDLFAALFTGSYGVTSASSWWWLAIAGPHSGTPFDLLSTAGTALMTIAVCQAAAVLLGRRSWVLGPLSAPGSMPLSVYSAHVIFLEITRAAIVGDPTEGTGTAAEQSTEFAIHALTFVLIPLVWKLFVNVRGPLEAGIAAVIRSASPAPSTAPGSPGSPTPRRPGSGV
ncbi:heparan-alpha-glucosaminide N-acetyltransferase domain-containing protein [Brevibacterium renqingii]|uniref:heparan-alpha-glucosaminide N-acetyltransferase domain-containing protein n=1 Tax=Brevibacterium renqingii TaxID=2776916 RepID=UPI001ADEDDD9|nr:heparan-alpha-glucosaminide N-acetyltransferase domain-containing protein [Brevibacterium renqingii]